MKLSVSVRSELSSIHLIHRLHIIRPIQRLRATTGGGPNWLLLKGSCVAIAAVKYSCVPSDPGMNFFKSLTTREVSTLVVASQFCLTLGVMSANLTEQEGLVSFKCLKS